MQDQGLTSDLPTGKLALLIPRLASDHDGEVVATARAIRRVLGGAGLDLHDLAARLSAPAPGALADDEWRASLAYVAARMEMLTRREAAFVANLTRFSRRTTWEPSRRQAAWLESIRTELEETGHA